MMTPHDQLTLVLDLADGMARQEAGKDRREAAEEDWLTWIRAVARRISLSHGEVCVDALRQEAVRAQREPRHPNTWGCVFRGPEWEMVGRVHSAVPSNRGREVKRWRYLGR